MPAPFLTVHDAQGHIHLILGTNGIANNRCQRSLDIGATPIVLAPAGIHVHHGLQDKIASESVRWAQRQLDESDLTTLGRQDIDRVVDAVFITSGGTCEYNTRIAAHCKRLRIPVNVTDAPSLCTFTLPSLYSDGPLQIGITTSGMGCKLAARIRRHVLATLPPNLGRGVQRLGAMRRKFIEEDWSRSINDDFSDEESPGQKSDFNHVSGPVDSLKKRRLSWLSQICEHWPLHRLASIGDKDIDSLLASYSTHIATSPATSTRPRIILAGAGPGSPHLLTIATRRAIETASMILADKLVPSAILAVIPRRTPVHIAEKFPGNADAAQTQLLELGLQALRQGHTVLRLKQGDPYIYGRGGEEVRFFRAAGYEPLVLPGLTSALTAPLIAGIPLTHRGVADDIRICTGVGRKGVPPTPPSYLPNQTVVVLMVLNRLKDFVRSLVGSETIVNGGSEDIPHDSSERPNLTINASPLWPLSTPCAIVERASCPDQRVIRSTLRHIVAAFEEVGSRPPGLLVLGRACEVLNTSAEASEGALGNGEWNEVNGDAKVAQKRKEPLWTVEEGSSGLEAWIGEVEMQTTSIDNGKVEAIDVESTQT